MSDMSSGVAALTAEPTAAPAATPATDPAAPAASAPAAAPAADAKWWASFADETTRGYAETKNFPSAEEAVRSYQNLEKLMGAKANAIMIPGDGATPEEMNAFYEKLGRPGAPENYAVPEAFKEDAMVKGFAGEAHKLGLTSKQFEGVMAFVGAQQQTDVAAQEAKRAAASQADLEALRKDLPGLKYDQLIEHGRRAARAYGLDGPMLTKLEEAFGTRGMLEFMGKIGAAGGEAPFIDGSPSGGTPTVEAAKLELASIQKDQAFMKKWMSGDTEAVARVNRLNAAIAAGVKA
ncbi:hypothetical protein [Burkholderia gladioli]|uniref:hypothetical protein n=1 Tax=Burkholderia gladioli TaxID=28095 RepID=UPI0015E6F005|nr:hypothetical protein [Burkholderia gladioli]MBA1364050.1 hypothetical protein [Burkholderia gladioli]